MNQVTEYLRLKKSNCKNCYKCIRNCPVKSIRFDSNQAYIIEDECIFCGQCFVNCPQNAKQIIDDTDRVRAFLKAGHTVVASVAPSFVANYDGAGIGAIESALKRLGFAAAEETAIGATMVKRAYDDLLADGSRDVIISSCCHSVNLLIQKHFVSSIKYLADISSPMLAHCADVKRRYPGAKTVFIGPCVSKKDEAARYKDVVDCVITFEDLSSWLEREGVSIERDSDATPNSRARLFPTTGGILRTMACANPEYSYIAVDGVHNCINVLHEIESGRISKCFIEMSACVGSCIGGPVMEKFHHNPIQNFRMVDRYAGDRDFEVVDADIAHEYKFIGTNKITPGHIEITAILKQMGKTLPEHELNCGSCGYDSCREKAIAVYQKKADLTMCLPFLKEKAESFSDIIIGNTPNGIMVLNEDLIVQQINKAARDILNIQRESDVLGEQVVRILDPKEYLDVIRDGRNVFDKRVYLAEYNKYVEQTVIHDRNYRILICLMRDVTDTQSQREAKESLRAHTISVADKVIEKQMTVVQEIASLLGETAAETKIALTKLKESLQND